MRTLLLLFLIVWGARGVAAEIPAAEAAALEKRFMQTQAATNTLGAGFVQTVSAPGLREPVRSEGRLHYRAPDDLLIAFTQPAGDILELRGDSFRAVRNGRETRRSANHPSARALVALREILRGQHPDDAETVRVEHSDGAYRVSLVPSTAPPAAPREIVVTVDARDLLVRGLEITLPRGATLTYDMREIRRNRPLPDGIFGAKPPQ